MPTYIPPPVIYSSDHHHRTGEDKEILAFWIALHLIPMLWIIGSLVVNLFKRNKYYHIIESNCEAWLIFTILCAIDLIMLLSFIVYKLI
jgi:uncharacterized membrane protein